MKRKQRGVEEKMSVVLEMLRGEKPVKQVCQASGISEALAYRWRDEAMAGMQERFNGKKTNGTGSQQVEVDRLLKLVGQQAYVIECQKKISEGRSL